MRRLSAALVVLALSACGGSHPAAPPGAAPFRAGRVFLCPGVSFPGYERRHLFYPPRFPATPPATVRPTRCFVTTEQARAAGYRPAPLPSKDVAVGPIYLVPAEPFLEIRCRHAAARVGFAVPCPGLLPSAGTVAGIYPDKGSFVMEWDFGGPSGYKGIPSGSSNHMFFMAARGELSPTGRNSFAGCPSQRELGRTPVRGHQGVVYACASGSDFMNSGHVLVRWREGGVVYEVSLHSPTAVNRTIAEKVAASIRLEHAA